MFRWLVVPVALAMTVPAVAGGQVKPAGLPTVFGIELGAPLKLPECKRLELPGLPPSDVPSYETQQNVICRTIPIQLTRSPFRRGDVLFPHDREPLIIVADILLTYFAADSDNVIAVEASTASYGRAESVVGELTTKFGRPTMDRVDRQIVDSMPLPSRHVVWRRPGFTVDYQSISDVDVRSGELLISTDAYDRLDGADAIDSVSRRTPL